MIEGRGWFRYAWRDDDDRSTAPNLLPRTTYFGSFHAHAADRYLGWGATPCGRNGRLPDLVVIAEEVLSRWPDAALVDRSHPTRAASMASTKVIIVSTRRTAAMTVLLTAAVLVMSIPAAYAAYPGHNGAIAFTRTYPHDKGDIWTMRSRGGDGQRLTHGFGAETQPAWSPDGSRIVFRRPAGMGAFKLIVMRGDGSHQRWEAIGSSPQRSISPRGGYASWSPSSSRLVFDSSLSAPAGNQSYDGLAVIELRDDIDFSPPGLGGLFKGGASQFDPEWSPDGSLIAFEGDPHYHRTDIYTMNSSGRQVDQLTRTRAYEYGVDWSPSGKRLLFIRGVKSGGELVGEVFMMDADGRHVRQLTDSERSEESAAWSPDGRRIVIERCCYGPRQTSDLFVIRADGSNLRRLTHTDADESSPDWRPV
jgi:dipeptidyl aminopeptidase/acylaminoacyl peptidase